MGIRNRRARTHSKTHIVGFTAVGILGFLVILAIALAVSIGAIVESWLQDLPDYTSADAYLVAEPSEVYDAQGNTIATFYLENRRSVTADQVSPYVLQGTVDVEDERFYQHNGIDPLGIMRAVAAQVTGRSEGASTITQQLVRNTVLSDEQFEKSLKRKVREAYIAVEMEKTYSKDQILMMYLNTIYYGHGAYGIEAASITYYNKHADELTLAEAATLVGLPNSPSYYDPTVNPDAAKSRRNKVLDNMLRLGHITQEEHDAAQAEELNLNPGSTEMDQQGTYPYWTNYVKGLLEGDFSQDTIVQSGLKIYTTIDPTWQSAADEAVTRMLDETNNASLDSALVAIDPSNGYIKAMVGGRDFYADTEDAQVNSATSGRQAGSSFKTIGLVEAIAQGMNPDVLLNCNSPLQITKDWKVRNYGNASYGTLSLREATWRSSNTGYGQVSVAIGPENLVKRAQAMGVSGGLEAYASTILGTQNVSPLEMAEVYSCIANGGTHYDPVAITKIQDRNGNTVYEHQSQGTQVMDPSVAKAVTDVLTGVITSRSGTASGLNSLLTIDQPVAGKTGTTEYFDNLWFCGYTPQVSVAVWTGHKSDSSTVLVNGAQGHPSTTSNKAFAYFVNAALANAPHADWPMADAADPQYKENSEWTFTNTSSSTNAKSASTGAATAATRGTSATAGAQATASEPSAESPSASAESPSQPAVTPTPTPTPEPESPTVPEAGSSGGGE